VVVSVNAVPEITGDINICLGATSQLTATGGAGQWNSSNMGVATISQTGLVTSVATGATTITFTNAATGCQSTVLLTVNTLPLVDFTFNNDNTCSGTDILFTPSVTGEGPFTYFWEFGDGQTSTSANPLHAFSSTGCATANFTVELTVTDLSGCSRSVTHQVVVIQAPHVEISDQDIFYPFSNCTNTPSVEDPNYTLTINNISDNTCATTYSIDWGDGTVDTNLTMASFPLSHTYTQLGQFNLVASAMGTNGCIGTRTYPVANQSNPAGSLGTLGSTTGLCAPATIPFTIGNWEFNSPGTTYIIDFGDGTSETLQHPLTNNVVNHNYTTSSCPATSFTATLTVINGCDATPYTAGNIQVRIEPTASFTAPASACVSQNVCFTNNTIVGAFGNCLSMTNYTWNFGDPASGASNVITANAPGTPDACHTFSAPGTYTVTLTAANPCDNSVYSQQICIEPPLTPTFTLSTPEGCGPLAVSTTNTTDLTNQCDAPLYAWTVSYSNTNCSTTTAPLWQYTNGTSSSSPNPSFNFVTPGTYSIRVVMTNDCGAFQSAVQTVVVTQPPTVAINTIAPVCGASTVTINPQATVTNCGSQVLSYQWSFPGGTPSTSTDANPSVQYTTSGSHTITLQVTNECGTTTDTETFTITQPVIANAGTDVTICNGSTTLTGIGSGGTGSGYTYSWSPATGLSSATAQNPTASPTVTTTYTLTVTNSNCTATDQVTVYVNQVTAGTIAANQTICSGGDPVAFTVQTPATGQGTLTYQWQSSTGAAFADIAGATDATYDAPALTQTTNFRRITTSTLNGVACTATSNSITVTVNNITAGTIGNDQTICTGGTPVAIQSTSVATASGTLAYQWESSTDNATWVTVPAATSVTYAPGALTQTTYYRRIARSTLNSVICSATSNVITITVVPDPAITVQPLATQSLCQNQAAIMLSVEATGGVGTPYSYQWYSAATSGGTGTIIAGATLSTYTPPTATAGTRYYYCIVTSPGAGCTVTSTVAEVIVIAAPVITTQPQSATLCAGATPAALTVAHSGGSGTPSYQWYSAPNATDAGTPIPTATSAVYQPSGAGAGVFYYYCVITFSTGGCNALTSNVAAITVNAVPSITTTQQATVCTGTAFTVTPANGGGNTVPAGTTYTWTAPTGTGFSGGSAQPTGQTSISQILVNTTNAAVTATYTVTPTSNNCTGAPFTVTVTVQPRPVMANITQTICSGESFSVTPLNNPPTTIVPAGITYTWGDPVVTGGITGGEGGSNQPQIGGSLINPTNTPQTATYTVIPVAPSGICNGQSFTITVTVNPMPSVNAPLAQTICSGGTFTVTPANGTDGVIPANTTYTWTAPAAVPGITGLASGTNLSTISGTLTNTTNAAITVPYTVTPKSGNCTGQSFTVNITVQPVPTVDNITSQTLCNGSQTNAITFTGTATGTVYNWTNNNTSIGLAASGFREHRCIFGNK
jgi:PKD repeat protein